MKNESNYIQNIFEPNIIDDVPEDATDTENLALRIAWEIQASPIGGEFIVTKTTSDTDKIYLVDMETGKRYVVTVTQV